MTQLLEGAPLLAGLPGWAMTALAMSGVGIILLGGIAVAVMVFSWAERKVAAYIQSRYGPMEVGPWQGTLQPIADGVKFLLKEDIAPTGADKPLWRMAPLLIFVGAFLSYVVIPFGPSFIGANLDVGLFYIFATSSIVVTGIIAAGWGSNNKWALYGAVRGAAQVISYEIPLALAIMPIVLHVGSLNLGELITAQRGWIVNWHVFGNWGSHGFAGILTLVFFQISFWIYFISSLAEVNRVPFDLPETESELVSGYHTEYGGMKFAFMMLGEYADVFVVSAIAVTVFLGGWYSGIPVVDRFVPAPIIFIGKSLFLVFVQMWLRWTLPRLRVDQLMHVCWKVLIPITLANLFLYGLLRTLMA
jgi:NADH-quinone oxidoreductase subunit H